MTASRLQVSLNNIQSQLKLENISSLAKGTGIKSLEELVIKIRYDLDNVKAAKKIIKKINVDISTLRKQLTLPAVEEIIKNTNDDIATLRKRLKLPTREDLKPRK